MGGNFAWCWWMRFWPNTLKHVEAHRSLLIRQHKKIVSTSMWLFSAWHLLSIIGQRIWLLVLNCGRWLSWERFTNGCKTTCMLLWCNKFGLSRCGCICGNTWVYLVQCHWVLHRQYHTFWPNRSLSTWWRLCSQIQWLRLMFQRCQKRCFNTIPVMHIHGLFGWECVSWASVVLEALVAIDYADEWLLLWLSDDWSFQRLLPSTFARWQFRRFGFWGSIDAVLHMYINGQNSDTFSWLGFCLWRFSSVQALCLAARTKGKAC